MITVERGDFGLLHNNCYILTDQSSGICALIDCAVWDAPMQQFLAGRRPAYLLLTHGHFDHIGGAAAMRNATAAAVLVHTADVPMLSSAEKNLSEMLGIPCDGTEYDRTVIDGTVLPLGESYITVLATPGHSPGSCCYLCDDALFSGDTLLCRSVGRTDFPGSDPQQMQKSLERLRTLAAEHPTLRVFPGHGALTTLQAEIRENPFLKTC